MFITRVPPTVHRRLIHGYGFEVETLKVTACPKCGSPSVDATRTRLTPAADEVPPPPGLPFPANAVGVTRRAAIAAIRATRTMRCEGVTEGVDLLGCFE